MKKIIILIILTTLLVSCSEKNALFDNITDTDFVNPIESKDPHDIETNTISNELESGGYTKCVIHNESYHFIDMVFVNYVGVEAYNEWIASLDDYDIAISTDDVCTSEWNIVDMIKYFNIDKENFFILYNNNPCYYYTIYDIDILYGGDDKKIEEFFKNYDYNDFEYAWRTSEYEFKLILQEIIDTVNLNNGVTPGDVNLRQTNIANLINKSGISRENAVNILNNINIKYDSNLNYDFDKIYNNNESFSIDDAIKVDDSLRISK